ncbi:hypothetical protein ACFPJ4_11875 [Lysinimonas soli]|uniref:DUF429 domain-containing protein n=1 Tax=Lysinimonas soli TaxID=1074233 RepID=A0ABW0NSF8_9MICO
MTVAGIEFNGKDGWVLLTQTCDVVRDGGRPNVMVAPVVRLGDNDARLAQQGKRPRHVQIPHMEDLLFADLEYVVTLPKSAMDAVDFLRGVRDDDWRAQRKFGMSVGRRFSRVAIPDEVVPWLSPMSDSVMDKALKPTSALYRAVEAVADFRIFSPDWYAEGIDLTLYFVLAPQELAPFTDDDDPPPVSAVLDNWLKGKERNPSEIAERLFPAKGDRPPAVDRDALWRAFANAFKRLGVANAGSNPNPRVRDAVLSFVVEVAGEDELTMLEFRKSDQLDLAHLSGADGPES